MGSSHSQADMEPAQWPPADNKYPLATFAGGCFWSVELKFQRTPGVIATAVGYTAGKTSNPTYEQVCSGTTGHTEAVQLTYDESQVSYETLVQTLLKKIDPTARNRQGNDVGSQYRSGIYYHTEEQRGVAEALCSAIPNCAVEVLPAGPFYAAETYHQQYLEKGGRNGRKQNAAKGCNDPIACYG